MAVNAEYGLVLFGGYMEKIDKYFTDWENHVFGYGYGTGEEYTLKALKDFMDCMEKSKFDEEILVYDHKNLYKSLGTMCTWLMINTLNHADILEYGTSPRFGWFTKKGRKLYDYLKTKTVADLYNLTTSKEEGEYYCCYPDHCNCEELVQGKCNNPFFKEDL